MLTMVIWKVLSRKVNIHNDFSSTNALCKKKLDIFLNDMLVNYGFCNLKNTQRLQ